MLVLVFKARVFIGRTKRFHHCFTIVQRTLVNVCESVFEYYLNLRNLSKKKNKNTQLSTIKGYYRVRNYKILKKKKMIYCTFSCFPYVCSTANSKITLLGDLSFVWQLLCGRAPDLRKMREKRTVLLSRPTIQYILVELCRHTLRRHLLVYCLFTIKYIR